MNHENARALAQLSDLTNRARVIDWQEVDASGAVFLARIGQLDSLTSGQPGVSNAADDNQRKLIEERRAHLESMIEAGSSWQFRQAPAAPETPLPQRAAAVVAELRAAGIEITAHRDGALSLSPAGKITPHLRSVIEGLQENIVAALRSDVLLLPARASKHRHV